MAQEIPPEIRKAVNEFGIYGIQGYFPNDFREWVGLTPFEPKMSPEESFRQAGTHDDAVRALWDACLITPKNSLESRAFETAPPEYRYFDLVPSSSAIVTTNNDGLSRWARPRLRVEELHGSVFEVNWAGEDINLPLRAAPWLQNHIRGAAASAQEFGVRPGLVPLIVRPKEPVQGALLARWERASKLLAEARSVILVGYSLSSPDFMVRDLFLDALRDRDISIWVLSPDPFEVVGALQELVRSPVASLRVYWDLLTPAILRTAQRRAATGLASIRGAGSEVVHEYQVAFLAVLAPEEM